MKAFSFFFSGFGKVDICHIKLNSLEVVQETVLMCFQLNGLT